MQSFVDFFKGKKAYLVGALMVALGFLQDDQNLVLQGLSVIFLRAGIAKTGT